MDHMTAINPSIHFGMRRSTSSRKAIQHCPTINFRNANQPTSKHTRAASWERPQSLGNPSPSRVFTPSLKASEPKPTNSVTPAATVPVPDSVPRIHLIQQPPTMIIPAPRRRESLFSSAALILGAILLPAAFYEGSQAKQLDPVIRKLSQTTTPTNPSEKLQATMTNRTWHQHASQTFIAGALLFTSLGAIYTPRSQRRSRRDIVKPPRIL